ncbi:MAG TPA: MgtC/SapB family protein [Chthoniobacterales bacterium]
MHWLTQDWRNFIAEPWLSIGLAVAAVVCGAIVGCEREKREKPIGTRTLTLVALGSAIFTMLSFEIGGPNDRARIAAQIVTGIGFLGAGAIIRGKFGITGLTSAATIWAVSAMGMLVGAGYVGAGLGLSVLILAVLTIISAGEQRFLGRCKYATVTVVFESNGGKTIVKIEEILDEYNVPWTHHKLAVETSASCGSHLSITYCNRHKHHREFLAELAALEEITEINSTGSAGP